MSQFESVNDYISFMKAHPNMTCPIKHTLDIIGGKWKLFIVLQLFGSEQSAFQPVVEEYSGNYEYGSLRMSQGYGERRHYSSSSVQ